MSIAKVVSVALNFLGDGVSTSYTVDLRNDPYVINQPGNNMSSKELAAASSIANGGSGVFTATLTNGVVTINFASPPAATFGSAVVFLLFA